MWKPSASRPYIAPIETPDTIASVSTSFPFARRTDSLHAEPPREREHRLREARHRSAHDAGTDLPDARFAVRDAGGDHRADAVVDDLADIDAARRPGEVECRQRHCGIASDRYVVQLASIGDRFGHAAADQLHERRRCREGEAAEAGRLADRTVAEVGIRVLLAKAR